MGRGSQFASPRSKALLLESGEHHHLRLRAQRKDRGQRLDTVHRWHRRVEQQQRGLVAMDQADRLVAVATFTDDLAQPRQLEVPTDDSPDVPRVITQHYGGSGTVGGIAHVTTVPSIHATHARNETGR